MSAVSSVLAALVLASPAPPLQESSAPARPPLWGELEPGPFAVGFRASFELDPARPFRMTFEDGTSDSSEPAPRPILVNLWYPAAEGAREAAAMHHGQYFELAAAATDERVARFARALSVYEHGVVAKELFDAKPDALGAAERAQFDALLATPTGCVRDAEPHPAGSNKGRFPLLIYHSGYGSSFDDDAVLCEWLASHGYVVAGSAFQTGDGSSFNIDAHEGTALDVDFLVARLRARAEVDASRVAMIGHSGGAHAALRQQARERSPLAAIVSLDTTEDYYSTLDPRWNDLTLPVLAHPERMRVPLLFCADPHAAFELADSLVAAERWYFTAELEHEQFIAQGVLQIELAAQRAPGDTRRAAEARRVRADWTELCRFVLTFLDAHLKDDAAARERLTSAHRDSPLGSGLHVEFAAAGASAPPPWESGASAPPTPRQFRPLLAALGATETAGLLEAFHASAPRAPIFHPVFAFALLYELAVRGQEDDVRTLGATWRTLVPDLAGTFTAIGDYCARFWPENAARCFSALLLVDPENAAARRRLAELERK